MGWVLRYEQGEGNEGRMVGEHCADAMAVADAAFQGVIWGGDMDLLLRCCAACVASCDV